MGDRIKRIFAFLIDLIIIAIPYSISLFLITDLIRSSPEYTPLIFIPFLLVIVTFMLVILRDVVFGARSIGKRIFGLYIVDKDTLAPVDWGKRTAKNLFLFLYIIDGIILLASGNSIGSMLTGVAVLSKKSIEERQKPLTPEQAAKKSKWTPVVIVVVIIVLVLAMFGSIFGIVFAGLEAQKNTEEYAAAYEYLIESDAFERIGADEDDIRMNSYSSSTYATGDEHTSRRVEIGFIVDRYSFEVVCHYTDGEWVVCEDCTDFR